MSPLFTVMLVIALFYIVVGLGARLSYSYSDKLITKLNVILKESESKSDC